MRRAAQAPEEVMVQVGTFVERVVYATKKHSQIGATHYQGEKRKVFIGFWGDCPVWKLLQEGDPFSEQEYDYCKQRTMPIDDDPDYCGVDPF